MQNSNLSAQEKNHLYSGLIYNSSTIANHSLIAAWNDGIVVNVPPTGVSVVSSLFIQNAWISLLTISPSVVEENLFLVPNVTTIRAQYDYDLVLPNNYYSSGYPDTDAGDCERTYALTQNDASYILSDASGTLGNTPTATIAVSNNKTISSSLTVYVEVDVAHSQWQSYCCASSFGTCTSTCHSCTYAYSQMIPDSVALSDSRNLTYDDRNISASFVAVNQYASTTLGRLSTNAVNTLALLGNASIEQQRYSYDVLFVHEPYSFLQLRASPTNITQIRNILIDEDTFILPSTTQCSVQTTSHFYTSQYSCSLNFSPINLSITLVKFSYQLNDVIAVDLHPKNTQINITYGNYSQMVENIVNLTTTTANKIEARIGLAHTSRIIHVKNPQYKNVFVHLSLFSGLSYFLYLLIARFWGGFLG